MSAARKAALPGRFIVLEGLDGAGTTTQTERLASALRADGHAVVTTREPSDGPIGTMLRQALTGRLGLPHGRGPLAQETLALLFAADRTDHLHARVLPALEEGKVVLCDRYVLSSLAYQGASLPMTWVDTVNAHAVSPDLTLFVGVDPNVAATRRAVRGGPAELFEADEAQRRIAKQYLKAITLRQKRERIVNIDGELSVEAVTDACLKQVRRLLVRKR
ncbi:dTMP kinase [Corallococcus interemptor]|uniref:Thymidylate kinase n=1 Tax=Corallococcus interemptor TaxID=2316720 RepID=A0A3A8QZT8_9BACT|nr:dTMP kinase [Corallococcus interemptor]RKH73301.1 dTMP kinase [Corallococcus interemptor]